MGIGATPGWRPGRIIWSLLLPAVLAGMAPSGVSYARFHAAQSGGMSVQAAPALPPAITPGIVNLELHVGDRCENSPVLTVTNPSRWSMSLSVSADGWLTQPASVSVTPEVIGPGQSATVSFTKAAVEGPLQIDGNIYVTADGGAFVSDIKVTGQVLEPAGAADPPYQLPPGCVSTPRPAETQSAPPAPEPAAPAEDPSSATSSGGVIP